MNISFDWLHDYVDFDLTPQQLADCLTAAGLAVDEVNPVGDDFCLIIDLTANRSDCLGHVGVAREVAAAIGAPLTLPNIELKPEGEAADSLMELDVQDTDLCIRYTGRVLSGIKVGPSPDWMVKRLQTIGVVPAGESGINNVVDITNYVLMECNQPLHAFDYARVAEHRIVVRRAAKGEQMDLLDESACKLEDWMLVIADAKHPLALAGVMGGKDSMIDAGTDRIILESASFFGVNVRRTTRKLGMATDSSYRFERTVDPIGVNFASLRAARLLVKYAGAKLHPGALDSNPSPWQPTELVMRKNRVRAILGIDPKDDVYDKQFPILGLEVIEHTAETLKVNVPSYRADITREVDLIEEAARLNGYDNIPEVASMVIRSATPNEPYDLRNAARHLLAAQGYDEVMTDSFGGAVPTDTFHPWGQDKQVAITEVSRKYGHQTVLRDALTPMVLLAKLHNQNGSRPSVRLFEIAPVFLDRTENLPEEPVILSMVADTMDGSESEAAVRGALEQLTITLHFENRLCFTATTRSWLEPGRGAEISMGGVILGTCGLLSRDISKAYDFKNTPAIVELNFDLLLQQPRTLPSYTALPRFPGVVRDVALELADDVPWGDICSAVENADVAHFESVAFLSEYRGKGLAKGAKSLAFRIRYRHAERSLTNEEVGIVHDALVVSLQKKLNASLRGV